MLLSNNHLLLLKEALAVNKIKSIQKLRLNAIANSIKIDLWYVSLRNVIYSCVSTDIMSIMGLETLSYQIAKPFIKCYNIQI